MLNENHLRSLNPKDEELVFGCTYAVYLKGEFLGNAIWTEDENIGNSFQSISEDNRVTVFLPDRWEIIN